MRRFGSCSQNRILARALHALKNATLIVERRLTRRAQRTIIESVTSGIAMSGMLARRLLGSARLGSARLGSTRLRSISTAIERETLVECPIQPVLSGQNDEAVRHHGMGIPRSRR